MKMDERYSHASYGTAGLAAFFASLSLQDWGFIIGVAFSIALGVLTYRLNRREQMKCSAAIFFAPKRDKFCTARRCQKDTFCTVQK